jgi:hypothetical protein
MPLKLTTVGQTLVFRPSGEVAVLDGDTETVKGAWRGSAGAGEEKANRFLYTLSGADQTPLPASYTFDDSNQLQVVLQAADAQSDPALLPGGIEISDQHDIIYRLVDESGNPTGAVTTLYGNLSIEQNTNALVIQLTGGGQARIQGDTGITSLKAVQNENAAFAANDLLQFRATTSNTFDDGAFLAVPAKLEFPGNWDIQNGQLVFISKISGDPTQPDLNIGFAGKIGAITAGFVYFADAAGTQAAFDIRGQHVFNTANSETDFNWEASLGFSDKKFNAKVDFDVNSVGKNGTHISLNGNMTLQQTDGGTVDLKLNLEADYSWEDNALVFKATVDETAGVLNYDLMLQGKFKFDTGDLTFDIHYTNAAGAAPLTIDLNFTGDTNNFLQAVAFHLQISPDQIDVELTARFSISQRFVQGVGRVMENPRQSLRNRRLLRVALALAAGPDLGRLQVRRPHQDKINSVSSFVG